MKSAPSRFKNTGIILFWLLLWQAASAALHNHIILVGPLEVIHSLMFQAFTMEFWKTIAFSFGKISLGFFLAFAAGIITGGAACRFPLLEDFLQPPISFLKSVPVASFIILALIWIGSENLSLFVSFIVVFPMIYIHTMAGFRSADKKLLEMSRVFRMPPIKILYYIYRPALLPHLISGCRVALGMSFKSGIAAEVIGVPGHSIGERLYMAKIYLSTADLFAWTLVIVVISAAFEALFLWVLSLASPTSVIAKEGRNKWWNWKLWI
jgi:NitT/TauT family transport system permease protein